MRWTVLHIRLGRHWLLMQNTKMHHFRKWKASKILLWDWQMSCGACGRSCWSWAVAQVPTCWQSYHRCGKMEAHNFMGNRAKLRVLLSVEVTHWAQLTSSTFTNTIFFSGILNFILQVMTGWYVNFHYEMRYLANENLPGCLPWSLSCRVLYVLRIAVV